MKMKVLETRQLSEKILLMAWSPRMDLLAVANSKGDISLHRLSWQKVWSLSSNSSIAKGADGRPETPTLLTWHPEGLSIVVGLESCAVLIDVETGDVTHYHDVKNLSSGSWSTTTYEPPVKDLTERTKHESLQSEFKFNRIESYLSVLLLGTSTGQIYVYIGGGVLLVQIIELKSPIPCSILITEITPDIQSFLILTHNRIDEHNGNVLAMIQLEGELIPSVADVLGAFAFKIEFVRSLWQSITDEMITMNENWGKIVEIYTHYMTYGSGKESENVRADYMELVVCGTGSIEMEIFLGSYGREKEAKKFGIALTAAKLSLNENLKNVKRAIIFMLTELNEIDGFYELISENIEACARLKELSRMYTYLYLSCLHFQQLADKFVKIFNNFMTLILVTIHTYHVMETPEPDPLDDESDPDKVLELLRFTVKKDLYEMIYAHDISGEKTIPTVPTVPEYADLKPIVDIRSKTGQEDLEWVPFWRHVLENPSIKWNESVFGATKDELNALLRNFSSIAFSRLNALYKIPLLDTKLEKSTYVLSCYEGTKPGNVGMHFDRETATCHVFHQEENDTGSLWFNVFDLIATNKPVVKTAHLIFSRPVPTHHFFSEKYLTILSYDPQDKRRDHESGRSIICQLNIEHILEKSYERPLKITKGTQLDAKKWEDLEISIPINVYIPGRVVSSYIDHIMPIEDFNPHMIVVSGARKVGSILGSNQKTIVLLEMELETPENTNNTTRESNVSGNTTLNLSVSVELVVESEGE